ncbi:hypothetical protein SAMN05216263_112232 [Metapseudomonas otitidis]|nr:hypothetical protein SAMN05216263_112232 [Pseudomonas otitidis]
MPQNPLEGLFADEGLERPESMDALLASARLLLPMLDAIPNAAIFIKDTQARYLLANRTLVQRCGLKGACRDKGKLGHRDPILLM